METCSTLIFSFCISATAKVKPLLKSLDSNLQGATLILIFFQKIRLFFKVVKKRNKTEIFFGPVPPRCPKILFSQIYVSSYPGTWNFVFSSKSCTRLHESEKTKSWDILKKSGWGRLGAKKNFRFVSFFANPKK